MGSSHHSFFFGVPIPIFMRINFYIYRAFLLFVFCLIILACSKKDDPGLDRDPVIRPITPSSSPYVSSLLDYRPAPGQFINQVPGNVESAKSILGKTGLVTLGAYGGYIVLGFDHSVINQAAKEDLLIVGNASDQMAEPGVVWVMQDENGNGQADDTWYEIAGSEFGKEGYVRDYQVTYYKPISIDDDIVWKDNKGNMGVVPKNSYHLQSYYPEWLEGDAYTLSGSLLPSTNIDQTVPTYIKSYPFERGYADNKKGGDAIDIDRAVDDKGNKVSLKAIDFVKIQTAIQATLGWLGEFSTEISSIEDLNMTN